NVLGTVRNWQRVTPLANAERRENPRSLRSTARYWWNRWDITGHEWKHGLVVLSFNGVVAEVARVAEVPRCRHLLDGQNGQEGKKIRNHFDELGFSLTIPPTGMMERQVYDASQRAAHRRYYTSLLLVEGNGVLSCDRLSETIWEQSSGELGDPEGSNQPDHGLLPLCINRTVGKALTTGRPAFELLDDTGVPGNESSYWDLQCNTSPMSFVRDSSAIPSTANKMISAVSPQRSQWLLIMVEHT
ncbi:hypothetical protein OBBRIDRAFT_807927, partial [Obba rivulosa]